MIKLQMQRKTVLLLFGGESSEHEVSISSARNVYAAMDNEKYTIELCYIDRKGKWWLLDNWKDDLAQHQGLQLAVVPGSSTFVTIPGDKLLHVDVLFPMLHGKNGEDGRLQGFADMVHIPYIGPSAIGAAITMDKDVTKRLLRDGSVPVSRWHTWHTYDPQPSYDRIAQELGATLFVKPSNGGSSIGVSKVRSSEEFDNALAEAAKLDDVVLIEEAISGCEVQVSVLGNDQPRISEICEIESVTDFHDFEDKYSQTSSVKFHIPARLSEEQTKRIKEYTLKAYKLTMGRGMARIDFFVSDEHTEYLNEINSIPGFTNVSVYPRLWRQSSMHYPELIDHLIELALE
jgi:D-alanine-D-alanine ligase